ncbi:MAG: DUF1330 domain-containing protein [Oceanospirillaceae bacterium]|nr:DUF1330 domain-containing protein [Oceanospirillaceae bacterium]
MCSDNPAYVIGHITVKDTDLFAEYRAQVPGTIVPWGGELVFRGAKYCVLSGEHDHHDTVVIRFPDQSSLDGWFNSEAYQALIPLRTQAADMVLVGYSEG